MIYNGNSNFTFSTGRTIYANAGIIGLQPGTLDVTEGYDSGIQAYGKTGLTPQERVELANFMIAQWEAFRDKAFNDRAAQADPP